MGVGVKVLQIAFYKFCVRLKSVTEQHMDELKKRPTRAGLPLPLSASELHYRIHCLTSKARLQEEEGGVGTEKQQRSM